MGPERKHKEKYENTQGDLLRGYSQIDLIRHNTEKQKLDEMMDNLIAEDFLECYKLCTELESLKDMKVLVKFAKHNQEIVRKIKHYAQEIPFCTRVLIHHSLDNDSEHDVNDVELDTNNTKNNDSSCALKKLGEIRERLTRNRL